MPKIALNAINTDMYREAHKKGISLSSYLEMNDPSPEGSKLDAFERLMKEAQIVTQSIPSKNIFASKMDAFYRTSENKNLFPEFTARTLIKEMNEFPLYRYLVAGRVPIEGNTYKGAYLDYGDAKNKKALEMRRVTEGADLPLAKLRLGEKSINIYKYGRAIEASYEVLRWMDIELFQRHIRKIASIAANNKTEEILTVIKDGDGNSNAAPKSTATYHDNAFTTTLTRTAWVKFLLSFFPSGCDTVVANVDGLIQILEVLYPKFEVAGKMDELIANGLNVKTVLPQNLITTTTLLYSPKIEQISGKEAIYAVNRSECIQEVFEIGSTISQADEFIRNQTKILTISENSGFMKQFADSAQILTIE